MYFNKSTKNKKNPREPRRTEELRKPTNSKNQEKYKVKLAAERQNMAGKL